MIIVSLFFSAYQIVFSRNCSTLDIIELLASAAGVDK
jgi:hypothetical protein